MMTFQQLSTLIKQGYTEDQIKQLNAIFSPEESPSPAPIPNPAPSPAPAPAPDNPQTQPAPGTNPPSPAPTPATESQPQQQPESETQKMLKEMLGLMRNGAINSIQQPTTPQVTTESILAKVLEP